MCHSMSVTNDGLWHIRSPMARMLYNKMQEDNRMKSENHRCWYEIDRTCLQNDELYERFVQFEEDMETKQFLDNCYEKSDWIFTQLYHRVMKSFLGWFMSSTSINGWLGRGSMFVFSKNQFQTLMGIDEKWRAHKLLDLGAGDGEVTQKMASHFDEIHATELSVTMQHRLLDKGYQVLGIEEWTSEVNQYDMVSCLNLLDRCDKPITILHNIHRVLKPSGFLLLALVLPFKPFVETGGRDHSPEQNLIITGQTFEEQLLSVVNTVITPAGFYVEKFGRLPYLCEGDLEHSFYKLDDVIFLLRPS